MSDAQTWTINRLGHHGDGVADGPVFAPLTLPGEVVTGTQSGQRLDNVRIISPSSDRVAPPCRHFKSCGGCRVQHASDAFVATWKQGIVQEACAAHGIAVQFREMHTSAPSTRRRATFSATRTKKGAMAGFHGRASGTIIAIPDCKLLHPDLMAGPALAQALAITGASRKAEISVSATVTAAGLDVDVSGGKPMEGQLSIDLAAIARQFSLSRLSWDGEVVVQDTPPEQHFGMARVVPPPGAFLQPTRDGEQVLVDDVCAHLAGAARVLDLFAGCGTFTFALAEGAQVHAVEGDAAMIDALLAGWRNVQGLRSITARARDLFRDPLIASELGAYDGVLLDPPRAGAEAQVRELAHSGVARIAYVSCNPASFARDARVLCDAGYVLGPVRVVDQFRWSSHTELSAGFTLKSS